MPRTHYDNLKVSRDAPVGVIHAAFRVLAAKYHPDLNPGDEKAAGIFRIVSRSHEVLSDPVKRAEHDRWIAEVETPSVTTPPIFQVGEKRPVNKWIVGGCVFGMAVLIAVALMVLGLSEPKSTPRAISAPVTAIPAPQEALKPLDFKRSEVEVEQRSGAPINANATLSFPAAAPSVELWPVKSTYVAEPANTDGNSKVTVDNTRNDSDMLVKLFDRKFKRPKAVRVFFLKANEEFTFENVTAGNYDIRYRNVDSRVIRRSKPFTLKETQQDIDEPDRIVREIGSSHYSLTLYTVVNGNTDSEIIGPDEF